MKNPIEIEKKLDSESFLLDLTWGIRSCSSEMQIWYLDYRKRWNLLRDLLLGVPLIRGKQRPRDFPLDPDTRRFSSLASDVHVLWIEHVPKELVNGSSTDCHSYKRCLPGSRSQQWPKSGFRYGEWFLVFSLLFDRATQKEDWPVDLMTVGENAFRTAIYLSIKMLVRAINVGKKSEVAWENQLMGVLGVSPQEYQHAQGQNMMGPIWERLCWENACAVSAACLLSPPHMGMAYDENGRSSCLVNLDKLSKNVGIPLETLHALQKIPLRFLTVKTVHVQRYLENAPNHAQVRGASIWCGQALGLLREYFVQFPDWTLISDHEAVITFAVPDNLCVSDELVKVRQAFQASWSVEVCSVASPWGRFPRIQRAHFDFVQKGGKPLSAFPDFQFRSDPPTSLLEVCLGWETMDEDEKKMIKEVGIERGTLADLSLSEGATMEEGPKLALPPWWMPNPQEPLLSWREYLWSLAGSTYRLHAHHGLVDLFQKAFPFSVHHGDLLQALGIADTESLMMVKIDGNDVGRMIGSAPILSRSRLGLEISQSVNEGLRSALRSVYAHSNLQDNLPFPVEIMFVGGDDVLVSMPSGCLDSFVNGFQDGICNTPFSYCLAAVRHPVDPGKEWKTELKQLDTRLLPGIMDVAKGCQKEDSRREKEGRHDVARRLQEMKLNGSFHSENFSDNRLFFVELEISFSS